jgi:hypothetical protein
MSEMIEPGPYRYVLEMSEPEQRAFGGEFVAQRPDSEESILRWLLGIHLPKLRGQQATVTRFELTRA